jgi:type IV pilus assembly protein PilO
MADNPLSKLPIVGQLLVSLGIGLVIVGVYWYAWPNHSEMILQREAKAEELARLEADIRALEVTVSKLAEFQEQVKLLEAKLERLKLILPPQKETPDLMKKVQALASQSALIIKKFNPKQTVNKDFYQEWPIDMDLEGTYHNLGMFFDRMSRLPRLVNVGNVKISQQSTQRINNTIRTSCVATTFVYVEKPPTPPAPAAGQPR